MQIEMDKSSAFSMMVNSARERSVPKLVPYLERYLDMKPTVEAKIEFDDFARPPRRKERFSPSSDCMRCKRDLFFQMCGRDIPCDDHIDGHTRMVFNIGTATHALIQAYLKDMSALDGFPHEHGEGAETRMWAPEWRMSGYIDDVLDFPNYGSPVALEIKTINHRGFDMLKAPKPEHRWQIGCYLMATGFDGGILLYIDKDTQKFKEFWVEEMDMQPVLSRWQSVIDALDADDVGLLPYECVEGSKQHEWCAYRGVCRKIEH